MGSFIRWSLAAASTVATVVIAIAAYAWLENLALPLAVAGIGLVVTCMTISLGPDGDRDSGRASGRVAPGYNGHPGGAGYSDPRERGRTPGNWPNG
jgi:hypothetical protein